MTKTTLPSLISLNSLPGAFDGAKLKVLFLVALVVGSFGLGADAAESSSARSLYTYSFGGLENMEPAEVMTLLDGLGYAGITVESRGEVALERLDQFYELSEVTGLQVVSGFISHRFDRYGFSDDAHRAAIDHLAPHGGTLWVWARDVDQDGTVTDEKVEDFFRGILEYAESNGVKLVLYPHYNTYFPTTLDALPLVEKINSPSLGIAINLCHELMSDNGSSLPETFARARDRLQAVILSGSLIELDRSNVRSMNESTIKSLDESVYDLRPFVRLIEESGYAGPVGFINFKLPTEPADYLRRSMTEWQQLCAEIGLYE
ncbi:MAG: sugar phosphate isomerase/epimerase [Opitutaceae bacterium]|jgi:sugar phosphate isomerase/epimerase|nr:sugar phosphate isomerase/epimerase [Opitutaceae bacterium]